MTSLNANTESFQKSDTVMADGFARAGRAGKLRAIIVLARLWRWILRMRPERTQHHRLRVMDRSALGDKNAVAIVQIDGRRFLIGAAQMSVTLLAELQAEPSFAAVMATVPKKQRVRSKKTAADKSAHVGDGA